MRWLGALAIAGALAVPGASFAAAAKASPSPPPCAVVTYPFAGQFQSAQHALHGPGLLLDGGGTDVDAAWKWMHDKLTGNPAVRGGNVVVLTADRDNEYDDWIVKVAPFASAHSISIPPCATRSDVDAVASTIDKADAVFFSGGDQADYVPWKNSALLAAIKRVYARGGIVGGTSAGLAVQGAYIYDSVAGDKLLPADEEVHTADAVKNPFEPELSFTTGYFAWPQLRNTITDTHFAKRNRFGRTTAFMARLLASGVAPGPTIRDLGVDERSALVVDASGMATLLMQPAAGGYVTRGAYFIVGGQPTRMLPGKPLLYTVEVTHLKTNGERFDLIHGTGPGDRYSVTVDGTHPPYYNRDPYAG